MKTNQNIIPLWNFTRSVIYNKFGANMKSYFNIGELVNWSKHTDSSSEQAVVSQVSIVNQKVAYEILLLKSEERQVAQRHELSRIFR